MKSQTQKVLHQLKFSLPLCKNLKNRKNLFQLVVILLLWLMRHIVDNMDCLKKLKYDEAYKRLHEGNNNIVRTGERLRKLGLPTTKKQSARLIELSQMECAETDDMLEVENDKKLQINE